jgi:GT2 family glycosyltransferase
MPLSLIIAVYKRLDFLSLVLQSLEKQTDKAFEVIIAEDDDQQVSKDFLASSCKKYTYPIKHVFQKDLGFRKNRILNEAVRKSEGEKLVFIDGDCMVHRQFVKAYKLGIAPGIVRAGRRIELSEKHTSELLQKDKPAGLTPFSLILKGVKYPEKTIYLPQIKALNSGFKHLLGCNWGITRNDLNSINGFDEDYELSGVGEDSDVEWRLLKAGIKIDSIVYSALQYHLYHPSHYDQKTLDLNLQMLEDKKKAGQAFCKNGLIRQ